MRSPRAYARDVRAAFDAGASRERTRQAHERAVRAYSGTPRRRSIPSRIIGAGLRLWLIALTRLRPSGWFGG